MQDTAEDIILIGAYLDAQALAAIGVAAAWQSKAAVERAEAARQEVARLGVKLDFPRWAGRGLSRVERRKFARAVERLERRGYVIRHGGRRRTTHVKLTSRGRDFALAILETPDDALMPFILIDDRPDEAEGEGNR